MMEADVPTNPAEIGKTGESGSRSNPTAALCASCDRCRTRKTKCDGQRPCGNCAAKYLKQYRLKSIQGIAMDEFDCVYSPAKRRGPVPGRVGQVRKANEALERSSADDNYNNGLPLDSNANLLQQQQQLDEIKLLEQRQQQLMMAQQQQQAHQVQNAMALQAGLGGMQLQEQSWGGGVLDSAAAAGLGGAPPVAAAPGTMSSQQQAVQQQLDYLQQLQEAQRHMAEQLSQVQAAAVDGPGGGKQGGGALDLEQQEPVQRKRFAGTPKEIEEVSAKSVTKNLHLLDRNDRDGNRLRAYYQLSVDELYGLPPIPTDEEYCESLNIPGMVSRDLPRSHQAALQASRFAEVALGALVHNEVALAMELSNATVSCLKECMKEPVQSSYMYEVARGYFLLGCFRAFRGDTERYFKYRRVCMQHLSKMKEHKAGGSELLLAAMSFLDAWAYMMHNADEKKLPDIDDTIPPVEPKSVGGATETENKYGVSLVTNHIVADPKNQMWIQGAPPVFLNNEAPLSARSLDALSCAIRSCCDQANGRFQQIEAAAKEGSGAPAEGAGGGCGSQACTPTTSAVMAHEDELCSRNMVLSAFTLLQQHEAGSASPNKNQGHHLIVSAMDAFLENGDEDGSGGFTDSQIQSLLSVCNTAIENPYLLHHGGPTYHMVSNAAILLCHLLNGMHAMLGDEADTGDKGMEAAVFEEVLDTYISVRKLLTIHRRKLPFKLRCHGLPRPSMDGAAVEGKPFIDLGETLMCGCRGCQGFVLMACSPCVAAERARTAASKREIEVSREASGDDEAIALDQELFDLESEFDLDDDDLLNQLARIIAV